MSKRNIVVVLLFCVFAVFSLTACEVNNVNDVINNAVSVMDEKADAYRAACDTVRENLDAPSEAKFPGYKSSFVTECASDNTQYDTMYRVNAYVDAQNAFGASMRSDWSARVYHSKSNNMFYVNIDSFGSDVGAGSATDNYETTQNSGGTSSSNSNTYSSNYGGSSSVNNSTNNSTDNSTYSYDDYEDDYEDEYEDDYEDDYDDYDEYDDYEEDYDSSSEYILPDSDSKKLTKYDLEGLSKAELRIARNEIYARHGRRFQDEALQDYFDEQDWYEGYIEPEDFVDSKMLSKLERRNAKFILKFE